MIESISNSTTTSVKPQAPSLSRNQNSDFANLLSSNKWVQLSEIAIVFSPVLIVIISARLMKLENPILLIAAVWVANLAMMGLIWTGIWLRGDSWQSIGLIFGRTSLASLGWTFLKSTLILIFAVVAFVFGTILMANVVGVPEGADMTMYNYMHGNLPLLLISLAGVYVGSSFGEEIIYRGFLITRLQAILGRSQRLQVIGAVVFSSIIFGFAHFEWGATGIVQTTCMGAALAISFLWTRRNLWPLVLTHACMDTMLLVPLYFAPETIG